MKKRVSLGIILITAILIVGALAANRAVHPTGGENEHLNAAFRVGVYLGTPASVRGESPHISGGRWARASDRNSFVAGDEQAYGQRLAYRSQQVIEPTHAAFRDATNAAYRDGIFLGKLHAGEDRPVHISIGRWSRADDRVSFTIGYIQGYDRIPLARKRESHGNRLEASRLR